ncbi:uncharacterized protein DUF3443 [Paraburkholderia sp. BL6669N2]|uniref:DUF3443 domain-containing protein n=1 Tax=Paraburkholderia sp. BL6669N2 TaxID=1938807 RepID=UPI000E26F828|nr:DUF3443 domain-containing protein [Paraburkholderia sp. BL6669N2]REG51603.1 uncharacterized protein DUF3443 [Paraburkholderia sp. BL6669N2]
MRKIARIIAAGLGLGLALSLAGCGGGGGSSNNATANAPVAASAPVGPGNTTSNPLVTDSTPNVLAVDASAVPTPANAGNTMSVTVSATGIHNQPMVSVKICAPGSNAATSCTTIPNVIVDTASFGLRLVRSAIPNATFSALTAETDQSSGLPLAECALFGSGYAWGSVHLADIGLSSEVAPSVPIHVIGDPALTIAAPSECQVGRQLASAADLGANGILGIGVSPTDCGSQCALTAISQFYYTDAGNATSVPVAKQISNPVARFPQDNNGVILEMAQVLDSGSPTAQGTLVFGIDTQANNVLNGTGAPILRTDLNGDFTSSYGGTTFTQTFFDSGSTVLFFPDTTIARDTSSGYYIPAATVGRTSTLAGTNPATVTLGFNIANAATLTSSGNSAFNNLGIYMTRQFDFGLPFFYGRHVYYGISGRASSGGGTGPYVAYVSS